MNPSQMLANARKTGRVSRVKNGSVLMLYTWLNFKDTFLDIIKLYLKARVCLWIIWQTELSQLVILLTIFTSKEKKWCI